MTIEAFELLRTTEYKRNLKEFLREIGEDWQSWWWGWQLGIGRTGELTKHVGESV
jgi:hypothetical protein